MVLHAVVHRKSSCVKHKKDRELQTLPTFTSGQSLRRVHMDCLFQKGKKQCQIYALLKKHQFVTEGTYCVELKKKTKNFFPTSGKMYYNLFLYIIISYDYTLLTKIDLVTQQHCKKQVPV